jgi:hypothetical protein
MTLLIRPQAKKFYFYNIITFDTETFRNPIENGEKLTFFNLDFYDGEQHYYSEKNNFIDMLRYFKTKYKKYTVIAHNIGFDFRIVHFINNLMEDEFLNLKCKARLLDSVLYVKFTSNNDNYVIQFLDSKNYFPMSLEKLAKNFNLGKINIEEYDLDYEEWNLQLYKTGKIRVMTDTEILYKAMQSFINMGFNYGVSLASTSFNTFKKQYLKRIIYLDDEFINLSLDIYHGGIVMPYILCKEKQLYDYDINSLYPYVMKNNLYSVSYKGKENDYRWIYDDIKNKAYNYILKVRYRCTERSPIFVKHDNQLMPFLEGEEYITGFEYLRLYENGYVQILEAYKFYNDDLFSEFIDYFYNKRLLGTGYEKLFYKLIMNSLYGKFGQHKSKSEFIKIDKLEPYIKDIIDEYHYMDRIEIDGEFYSIYGNFVSKKIDLPVRYNPLIASEITANARMINYDYSKLFGFENVYYTDTDSFFTTSTKELLEGSELGKLKIQKKGLFSIYAPKDYEFYGKCDDEDCKICKDGIALHRTIKGVKEPYKVIDNEYINKKWSKIKYKENEDVYIESIKTTLQRLNKKMKYIDGIGYEWLNKKEYNKYYGINDTEEIVGAFLNNKTV